MKIKIRKGLLLLFLVLSVFSIGAIKVAATTGTLFISSSSSITVNNTVSVTIKASASKMFYWQLYVSYDTSRLKLISGNTTIQGEADDATYGTSSVSQTLKFTTLKTGTAYISVARGAASMNIDADFNPISYTTAKKNISIIDAIPKSTNNNLSALSVSGGTLTPAFNADVTAYTVELAPNTTTVNVAATAADGKSSIAGAGDIAVVDGANTINVVVTAQNGTTKTYVINATVKELSPIEVKIGKATYTIARKKSLYEAPKDFVESSIKMGVEDVLVYTNAKIGTVIGLKDTTGKVTLYLYDAKTKAYKPYNSITINGINLYLKEVIDKSDIPVGYKKTTLKIGEQSIIVYNYKNDDNYYLINGVNTSNGIDNFYLYDKEKATIQRFYNDQVIDINKDYKQMQLIAIIAATIALLLIVTNIILLIRKLFKRPKKQTKEVLTQDSYIEVTDGNRSNKKKR